MSHNYEELRQTAVDVLLNRSPAVQPYPPNQFGHLVICVAYALNNVLRGQNPYPQPTLQNDDLTLLGEVFWDLFRDGIITLGVDGGNERYPFFRLTRFAAERLAGTPPYHFHDVQTYEKVIRENVSAIDDVAMRYLGEAMRAFSANCMLAAAVMLGVATEHVFLLVVESADASQKFKANFAPVSKERTILQRVIKFKRLVEQHIGDFRPT